jgi:hypothetical protein
VANQIHNSPGSQTDAEADKRVAEAEARQLKQAARGRAAQIERDAQAEAREIRDDAQADADATVEAVAKDNVEAVTELTRRVWERNLELAVRLLPAYIDAYERTAKSFSALYRQGGQAAGQVGASSSAPRLVGEAVAEAGQAAGKLPQVVGQTLAEAAIAASRVPQVLGEAISGQLPQSLPGFFGAQADLIRESAEATATATRQRLS